MCNNLLQYAHVYAWALEHGRKSVSMRFCYKYPYFHIRHTAWHNPAVYVLAKFSGWIKVLPVLSFNKEEDEGSKEKEKFMLEHRNLIVEGWHVRYYDLFYKYKEEIKKLFDFDETIKSCVNAKIPMDNTLKLGVHIRRGDYKTFYDGMYYYDDAEYISHIMDFCSLFPDKKITVVICGNYGNIDKQKFYNSLNDCEVIFPEGNPGEDLYALSKCDYIVGAPSSFSLVASMYNDAKLFWMVKGKPLSIGNFRPFNEMLPELFYAFRPKI